MCKEWLSFPAGFIVLSSFFLHGAVAQTYANQSCTCDGQSKDRFSGGDGRPLDWSFSTFLVQQGTSDRPTWICYLKKVSNKSTLQVRNIHWEVAGFYRDKIESGRSLAACPTIPGELKPNPIVGPLHYALSSHYDTTVRQPNEGWTQAQLPPGGSSWPIVRSVFEVAVTREQLARIVVYSAVTAVGKENILTYDIANTGNGSVRFRANLAATPALIKDVPIIQEGIDLRAGSRQIFQSRVGSFDAQIATVIIYDAPQKNILAVDEAGFYVPSGGKRLLSDEEFWRRMRSR
jgi:hypothetical protein